MTENYCKPKGIWHIQAGPITFSPNASGTNKNDFEPTYVLYHVLIDGTYQYINVNGKLVTEELKAGSKIKVKATKRY
jgi:hypothetical protein